MIITCPEISIRPDGCLINGTKLNSPPTLNEICDLLGVNPSSVSPARHRHTPPGYSHFCFHDLGLILHTEAAVDGITGMEIDLTEKFILDRPTSKYPYPGTLFYCPTQNEKFQLFANMNSNTCVQLGLANAQYDWFEKQFPDFLFRVQATATSLSTIHIFFTSQKEAPTD